MNVLSLLFNVFPPTRVIKGSDSQAGAEDTSQHGGGISAGLWDQRNHPVCQRGEEALRSEEDRQQHLAQAGDTGDDVISSLITVHRSPPTPAL